MGSSPRAGAAPPRSRGHAPCVGHLGSLWGCLSPGRSVAASCPALPDGWQHMAGSTAHKGRKKINKMKAGGLWRSPSPELAQNCALAHMLPSPPRPELLHLSTHGSITPQIHQNPELRALGAQPTVLTQQFSALLQVSWRGTVLVSQQFGKSLAWGMRQRWCGARVKGARWLLESEGTPRQGQWWHGNGLAGTLCNPVLQPQRRSGCAQQPGSQRDLCSSGHMLL